MAKPIEHVLVFNDKPTSFKKDFCIIETDVVYYLLRTLKYNEFKYIMTLLMTRNKYALSNKVISRRTGIDGSKFPAIRRSLQEKGFIEYQPYVYIAVRYQYIKALARNESPKLYGNSKLTLEDIEELYKQVYEEDEVLAQENEEAQENEIEQTYPDSFVF